MNKSFLPADDLPPTEVTQLDQILRFQLERSTGRCFYEACDAEGNGLSRIALQKKGRSTKAEGRRQIILIL